MLQHPLQHQLAPVALSLLALERTGQIGRLVAQALVELLQTLQFLAQGKALARFLLITLIDALLECLDALLEWVEQLAEALLAGLRETLLALIEDLRRQFGELGAQLVARALQIVEALLLVIAVFLQLGSQRRTLGGEPTQFGFVAFAMLIPGLRRLTGNLPLLLQQLVLTTQAGQLGLLLHLDLADLGQLGATGIELSQQTGLAQLRMLQAFLQQRLLALRASQPALQGPKAGQ